MSYTITAVSDQVRQWASEKAGPMNSYRVTLKDTAGVDTPNVELAQKAATPAPQVGQALDGNLDQTPYGLKFKKAFNGAGGGGGGGRPKSPEEQAQIAASVALKWAVEAVEQAATLGISDVKPQSLEEHAALLKRYADYGFAFIDKKGKAAA